MQRLRLRGLIILAITVAALIGGLFLAGAPHGVSVYSNSAASVDNSQFVTSYVLTVHWTDQPPSTEVYLTDWSVTCSSNPLGLVANGSGPSGTVSASLSPGTSYWLYACSGGSSVSFNATIAYSGGVEIPEILIALLLPVGVILIARSYFPPKSPPASALGPAPESPPK